jgi:hypothetical protein
MAAISPNTPMIEKKKPTPAKACPIPKARCATGEVLFIGDSPRLLHAHCAVNRDDRNHPIVVLAFTPFVTRFPAQIAIG